MATVTTKSWNESVERQFPWIDTKGLTQRIAISKVSEELLEVIPSEEYGTLASQYYTNDRVRFHDSEGNVLGEVSPRVTHSDANDMSSDQYGETIGDAWASLQSPADVKLLTRCQYTSGGCLSHDPDESTLEIFKVAEFDIRRWMFQRDKASDLATAGFISGLDVGETHDGETLKRLHNAVDDIYRRFALEEVRHSEFSLSPCPAMEDNPWAAFGAACFSFLERDSLLLTKYGSGTEAGRELRQWAEEQAKGDSGIRWDLNRWEEDVHQGDRGTEKVTEIRAAALRSLLAEKEIHDQQN